jgi:hypothetical protein
MKPLDQLVEIAKLIAETAKDTNPKVHRLINNCCINADYIQIWTTKEAYEKNQLVTPHQFIKLCHESGVDFTITGQQLYYQYTNRDLADTIRMTERLKKFGKPVQVTEIGATSGPTKETVASENIFCRIIRTAGTAAGTKSCRQNGLNRFTLFFTANPGLKQ